MFSLIHGFYRWYSEMPGINAIILGLDHAGKTTFLEQIKRMFTKRRGVPLDQIPPTVGMVSEVAAGVGGGSRL